MTVRQNVNIEKLEEFRKFLKDNPDKAQLKLEARRSTRARWDGR